MAFATLSHAAFFRAMAFAIRPWCLAMLRIRPAFGMITQDLAQL